MLIAFTYLPGFVTIVFRGMPTVWRGRHRLIFCWLICIQAVHPGRKTLEELAKWTPTTITAWRFGRLLKAAYWNVHLLVSCQFLAQHTHPYTSLEKGRKALLERLRQGMGGVEADADHPAPPPPDDARHRHPFLKQPYQTLAV
jgi:hypothetical protein